MNYLLLLTVSKYIMTSNTGRGIQPGLLKNLFSIKRDVKENVEQKEQKKLNRFQQVMENNKKWSKQHIEKDPEYFKRLVAIQRPQFLWIGCADSRVPANEILGLNPGEVFVHRNVANLVPPNDINVLAVIQFAVQSLQVKEIIVAGHLGCGGIKAAFNQNDYGPLEGWLSYVRQLRSMHKNQLLGPQEQQQNDLVEMNVRRQVLNVARIPSVQKAWHEGKQLKIHGLVYKLQDGLLKDLGITLNSLSDVPQEYRVFSCQNKQQKPKL